MKRKFKTQIFLVVAISFLLPLLSAYASYYILMEADFLSAFPKFENSDLDCVLVLKKEESVPSDDISQKFCAAGDLIGYLFSFNFPVTVPQVNTFILRC